MGWKDINLNRHKPQPRFAVIPVAEGQDRTSAVLARACDAAWTAFMGQGAGPADGVSAGYLAGFARHQALRHGVDAETDAGAMAGLLRETAARAGQELHLGFLPRAFASPRTSLGAGSAAEDAGYLLGHLESLCGTRKLLRLARELRAGQLGEDAFLTACDGAADKLQTHQPTAVLRFTREERAAVVSGLFSP